jgi:hypothetical protein
MSSFRNERDGSYHGEKTTIPLEFQTSPIYDLLLPFPLNPQIELPAATRNFYVDGHVPKPH